MSLQRLVLRAGFVAALKDKTIAQDRVFDTMLGPIVEGQEGEQIPFICIYTDLDKREQLETRTVAGHFRRTIDVQLEIAVATWQEVPDPEGGDPILMASVVETDAELEALLDLFEMQIWRAIYDPLSVPAGNLIGQNGVIKDVHGWNSLPGRSAETQNKISARQLTLTCEVADDCRPLFSGTQSAPAPATYAPYLTDLLERIEESPSMATLQTMLEEITGVTSRTADPVVDKIHIELDINADEAADVVADIDLPPT